MQDVLQKLKITMNEKWVKVVNLRSGVIFSEERESD